MSSLLLVGGLAVLIIAGVALVRGKALFVASRKQAFGWMAVALVAMIIGASTGSGSASAPTPTSSPGTQASQPSTQETKPVESGKPNLEVVETNTVSEDFMRYVTGTVKNNSNKKYSYAQVEINLYDKDGNQVGSTLANINNLEPGGTWKFKAPHPGGCSDQLQGQRRYRVLVSGYQQPCPQLIHKELPRRWRTLVLPPRGRLFLC
ncbi:MAG: FxLYD domain-containing protein [Bacillota bacterium]